MAGGRGQTLCCRDAGLRSRSERWEDGGVGTRERWRGRGGGFQPEGGGDGEGPRGRTPQGETLELQRTRAETNNQVNLQQSNH